MSVLKPLPHPIPKTKRPKIKSGPQGNRLTLILGLKCADTVVLAAETEESVGIAAKRNVYKLKLISGDDWAIVLGGAGDSAIAENAMRLIDRSLTDCADLTEDVLTNAIDDALEKVHKKYIDLDPQSEGIALIVGAVCSNNALHLISTHKRIWQFQESYAYAGLGADLAIYFLDRLHDATLEWEDSAKVAGFVLEQVKEAAQCCGGDSQFYALHAPPMPRWRALGTDAAHEIGNECRSVAQSMSEGVLKKLRSSKLHRNEYNDYEEEPSS
jgi:20S proteasome alpha/beta subunit